MTFFEGKGTVEMCSPESQVEIYKSVQQNKQEKDSRGSLC